MGTANRLEQPVLDLNEETQKVAELCLEEDNWAVLPRLTEEKKGRIFREPREGQEPPRSDLMGN